MFRRITNTNNYQLLINYASSGGYALDDDRVSALRAGNFLRVLNTTSPLNAMRGDYIVTAVDDDPLDTFLSIYVDRAPLNGEDAIGTLSDSDTINLTVNEANFGLAAFDGVHPGYVIPPNSDNDSVFLRGDGDWVEIDDHIDTDVFATRAYADQAIIDSAFAEVANSPFNIVGINDITEEPNTDTEVILSTIPVSVGGANVQSYQVKFTSSAGISVRVGQHVFVRTSTVSGVVVNSEQFIVEAINDALSNFVIYTLLPLDHVDVPTPFNDTFLEFKEGVEIFDFQGATSTNPGLRGYVPANESGQQDFILQGNATWSLIGDDNIADDASIDRGKLQDLLGHNLMGRHSPDTGSVQAVGIADGLEFVGGNLQVDTDTIADVAFVNSAIAGASPIEAHFNPAEFFLNADSDSEVTLVDRGIGLEKLEIGDPSVIQEDASSFVYGVRASQAHERFLLRTTITDQTLDSEDTFRYSIFDGTRHPISAEVTNVNSTITLIDAIIADSDNYSNFGFLISEEDSILFPGAITLEIDGYINDGTDAGIGLTVTNEGNLASVLRAERVDGGNASDGAAAGSIVVASEQGAFTGFHWEQIELFDDVIFAGDTSRNVIAIGAGAGADTDDAIAIGAGVQVTGESAIAIGSGGANADTDDAIAIGRNARALHTGAVAIGHDAAPGAGNEIRLGSSVHTVRVHPSVAGTETHDNQLVSKVYVDSEVSAADSNANAAQEGVDELRARVDTDGVRIGTNASGQLTNSTIVIGHDALASDSDSIAIGHDARVTNDFSIAIGSNATANAGGTGQIAIGAEAIADSGTNNIAIGVEADASLFTTAIALGPNTRAGAQSAIAIGHLASAAHAGSVAIGRDAATHVNDVIAAGRSALYDEDNSLNATREGAIFKLPVRHSLPDVSDNDQINDAGERIYEGMMCIVVPSGNAVGNNDNHIAIYFQGAWRRINFGDTISPD